MIGNMLEYFAFSDGHQRRLVRKERPLDDIEQLIAEIEASAALPLVFTHAAATPQKARVHLWHQVFDWLATPATTLTLPMGNLVVDYGLYPSSAPRFYDLSLATGELERALHASVDTSAVYLVMQQLEQVREQHHSLIEQMAATLNQQVRAAEAAESAIWTDIAALVDAIGADEASDATAAALQRTQQRRDWLIDHVTWKSSQEIALAARGGLVASNKDQYAYQLRQTGQIFGVRHNRERKHPLCQFHVVDGRLEPLPVMKPLLALLPQDESGWEQALWLFQPTGRLGGARPADVLATRHDDVLLAAKKDFHGDDGI